MMRSGFSLFEVLVAMTVCVSGIVLILGMLQRADQFSQRGKARIEQQILCQNLTNRLRLGIAAFPDTQREECDENEGYWYSLNRTPYPPLPLTRVEVSVWPKSKTELAGADFSGSAVGDSSTHEDLATSNPSHRFTLVFLMPNRADLPAEFTGEPFSESSPLAESEVFSDGGNDSFRGTDQP